MTAEQAIDRAERGAVRRREVHCPALRARVPRKAQHSIDDFEIDTLPCHTCSVTQCPLER
jgi:hypothetical protein